MDAKAANLEKARQAKKAGVVTSPVARADQLRRRIAVYERRIRLANHRLEGARLALESLEIRNGKTTT